MFKATDTKFAPWTIVPSDDKRRARLNCIRHLLKAVPYEAVPRAKVKLPKRSMNGAYDDVASLKPLRRGQRLILTPKRPLRAPAAPNPWRE
jgi:hypothetical protein